MLKFLSSYNFKKTHILFTVFFVCLFILVIYSMNIGAATITSGDFSVDYNPQNDWGSGSTVNVKITNSGPPVQDWTVSWTFTGNQKISNMWNATYTQNGNNVTVKNSTWNGSIATNSSQEFGFNITYSGSNTVPNDFKVTSSSSSQVTVSNITTTNITSEPVLEPSLTVPVTTAPITTEITQTPVQTNKVKGSEVLVIGESFIAMSHEITRNLEQNARNAGIIEANDSFRDNSVSGTRLSGGISPTIPQQYQNAIQQSPVKYVIMDGGGNDCLQSGGSASADNPELQNAVNTAQKLLNQMNSDGVVKVIYFFYPEPQGSNFGGLKSKLDVLRPMIKNVVNSTSNPQCYWLDLRPVFEGKYSQYITSDGIHPTSAGCKATADAIWEVVQQNNFFNEN